MPIPETTVAQLVLEHPESARVLQKYRIDFCCQGERTLADACAARQVDLETLEREIERALSDQHATLDLRSLPTPALVAHIVEHHHGYLREALPFVCGLAAKVARVHGASNDRLCKLEAIMHELRDALEPHLDDEEQRLFPALVSEKAISAEIDRELSRMTKDHEEVGGLLLRIRSAAEDFRVPDWACRSYSALFSELERLEADVFRHVHAENYVLRPRYLAQAGAA